MSEILLSMSVRFAALYETLSQRSRHIYLKVSLQTCKLLSNICYHSLKLVTKSKSGGVHCLHWIIQFWLCAQVLQSRYIGYLLF